MRHIKKSCVAAALAVPALWLAPSAGAQGLALDYKLNVNSESAQPRAMSSNRCAGLNWLTSLGACGRDLLMRISSAARTEAEGPSAADSPPTFEPALPNAELPNLGVPLAEPVLRSGGGKEALVGNSKAVDVLFRFGSKYRLRSADEGWEWYRFTDYAYENRRSNSLHKAVGVELLVPFQ